ncbi:MAG: tetratricopeptide repeat protein [Proteobacteria bacterium]|nr:tetratricopeptide repeat protein [Pseudomonadota bacterium]MBU1139069.1 tetratricopeptide repeat protein [Pseudomonadota bacterium]MBU1418244.1 tetratricopeptide repeat protein [Pseudomonadota bacterium]MBU1453352.1 tetratricopeptide repeat protein [Pseudomonadota bacterium]
MQYWKTTGVIATLIIVLSLPLYVLKQKNRQATQEEVQAAGFIGSEACAKCHKKAYEEWQGSHHAKSMTVASEETVLGNFNDVIFEKHGIESRFYRKDNRFFVYTRGPKGEMAEFEITHTFGWYPLQQYLIPFPGGRLQCLPIAWDAVKKKWFHLYPDLDLDPAEWIYWTNQGQNWNSMCADCHSTELQKSYKPDTDTYETKWAEISVGCEACHGPGSKHLAWAELPEMARPADNDALLVQTSAINNQQQVDLCAPCHSRRSMLGDYAHLPQDLLDTEMPRLLEEGLYHADGQILDEVYVYGSFLQAKMYANDVRCSDCHNVHTIKLHQEGNALCLQCHQASLYDTKDHHFHKNEGMEGEPVRTVEGEVLFAVGTGAQCIQCHMPGRIYMGNDYRPDHSIRIPRPDLSIELGTPNACNRCHGDKTNEWSAEYTRKWYGSKKKYHYGSPFSAARAGKPQAREELLRIISDNLASTLVRATAISLLGRYQGDEVIAAFRQALESDEAIIRRTALINLPHLSPEKTIQMVGPLLDDPIKGVRIEAARALTRIPAEQLDKRWQAPFTRTLEEFRETSLYSADFAASRLNLGTLASYQGQLDNAEEHFTKAVAIDPDFHTARTNLAILYNRQGKNNLAEEQLRKALAVNPDLADVHYSLGLLLSEQRQYEEAAKHLAKAAADMPENARAHYNLGQLLAFLHQDNEAERALKRTIALDPGNMNYLQAIAQFYLAKGKLSQARDIAKQMITVTPDNPIGQQLLQFIDNKK